MYKIVALFFFLCITIELVTSQKMISDTIFINFGKEKFDPVKFSVDSVIDKRKNTGRCVAINETKKYLYVPVDQFVFTEEPVADEIFRMFTPKTDSEIKYKLEIKEFSVGTTSGLFTSGYSCTAAISLYTTDSVQQTKYFGTLLYEKLGTPKRNKRILKNGYEMIIDEWKRQFTTDIKNITALEGSDSYALSFIPNFRKEQFVYKKNVLVNVEYIRGIKSWLVDGELIFSLPEAQKKFIRNAYSLRYRNDSKYESFETTLSNRHINYRLSDKFLFTIKSKMFFGVNRWKENEYSKHGLEDLFLLDYSLSQHVVMNRFFKKGFILGVGIMEDLTYIYSQDLSFNPYLVIQAGLKF